MAVACKRGRAPVALSLLLLLVTFSTASMVRGQSPSSQQGQPPVVDDVEPTFDISPGTLTSTPAGQLPPGTTA
ncbi:hypothetical protein HaLaN_27579, partial [Haematococcus lacustris]